METEKILISTDNGRISEFKKAVTTTADAANNLIELYNTFNLWERIDTEEAFLKLVADPKQYFDDTLLRNIQINTGGKAPNPEVLAQLVGIHRDEFLNATAGLPLTSEDCEPCRKIAKQIPGKKAVSKYQYEQYRDYLLFTDGTFSVNETKVNENLGKFDFYAETEEEIRVYRLHHDTVKMLNEYTTLSPISTAQRETIKTALKLRLSQGHQGEFQVDPDTLKTTLTKIKYYKDETDRN